MMNGETIGTNAHTHSTESEKRYTQTNCIRELYKVYTVFLDGSLLR